MNAPDLSPAESDFDRPTRWITASVLLLLAFMAVLRFVVPIFAAMFADFGAKLPALTQLVIDFAGAAHGGFSGLLILLLYLGILAVPVLVGLGRIPRVCIVALVLGEVLALTLVAIGFFLPIFELGQVAANLK